MMDSLFAQSRDPNCWIDFVENHPIHPLPPIAIQDLRNKTQYFAFSDENDSELFIKIIFDIFLQIESHNKYIDTETKINKEIHKYDDQMDIPCKDRFILNINKIFCSVTENAILNNNTTFQKRVQVFANKWVQHRTSNSDKNNDTTTTTGNNNSNDDNTDSKNNSDNNNKWKCYGCNSINKSTDCSCSHCNRGINPIWLQNLMLTKSDDFDHIVTKPFGLIKLTTNDVCYVVTSFANRWKCVAFCVAACVVVLVVVW